MTVHKYIVTSALAFAMAFAIVALPAIAIAQVDQGEAGATFLDRTRNFRNAADERQAKIDALPTAANPIVTMPVLFGVGLRNISPNFGVPRSGGRTHEGEDIMATKGTPIVSPTPAVVLRLGTGVNEGLYVYTANPGGETFVYIHLDRIAEGLVQGSVLETGSLIGYVGNTGNASGGAAHLHFEIHNSAGVATDPYPRLAAELSLQEKMTYLTKIMTQTTDPAALSQFLISNFRSTFTAAIDANITLPDQIVSAMGSMPYSPSTNSTTQNSIQTALATKVLPAGDIELRSTGAAVIALQKYLILASSGSASNVLATKGATGNFAALTKAALVEFQIKNNISPADGYYGPVTRTYVESHPIIVQASAPVAIPTQTETSGLLLTRNLYKGNSSEDVRTLQKLLNSKGFPVATSGVGSAGFETTYFGPATLAAVIKFQTAKNISPNVGSVGPLTRAALNL
ncbi:MAG: peptidoglycan DD-metalloendopeptidase family protein [Candidatus Pacebacteria bacterium]|nr:peptidoglycan DD-metalloendopeptidase family protein [Candidatus Paceibacterota bacterium]